MSYTAIWECSMVIAQPSESDIPNKPNEDQRPGEIASEFTYNALGRNVPIIYARRVGKTLVAQNRRVLIRLKHYNDVLELIQSPSNWNIVEFQHFHDSDSAIEMVHKNFLNKSLNINKHASSTCVVGRHEQLLLIHIILNRQTDNIYGHSVVHTGAVRTSTLKVPVLP